MSENIKIKKYDSPETYEDALKIRTGLLTGGRQNWVPENDAVDYCRLREISASKNMIYRIKEGDEEIDDEDETEKVYDCDGFTKIDVNVNFRYGSKRVTENGVYDATEEKDDQTGESRGWSGYSSVHVDIPGNTGSKTITENGTYVASDDGYDGYDSVTVNVENPLPPDPPVPEEKYDESPVLQSNGTYNAINYDLTGFSVVHVNVSGGASDLTKITGWEEIEQAEQPISISYNNHRWCEHNGAIHWILADKHISYDPIWGIRENISTLPRAFQQGNCQVLEYNNRIHVFGGVDSNETNAQWQHWTWEETEGWIKKADATADFSLAAVLNDTIYAVIGGKLYSYDNTGDSWTDLNITISFNMGSQLVAYDGFLYNFGYSNPTALVRIDPVEGVVESVEDSTSISALYNSEVFVHNGKIYVFSSTASYMGAVLTSWNGTFWKMEGNSPSITSNLFGMLDGEIYRLQTSNNVTTCYKMTEEAI